MHDAVRACSLGAEQCFGWHDVRMDEFAIRCAEASDAEQLVAFWAHAGENHSRPTDRLEHVERLIAHDPESVIVAERAQQPGRIAATIVAGWDGWRANLYRLAVDPSLRGQGLGRRMLQLAEDRFRQLGAERFSAMVLDDNEVGRALWSSAGYSPQQTWHRWIKSAT